MVKKKKIVGIVIISLFILTNTIHTSRAETTFRFHFYDYVSDMWEMDEGESNFKNLIEYEKEEGEGFDYMSYFVTPDRWSALMTIVESTQVKMNPSKTMANDIEQFGCEKETSTEETRLGEFVTMNTLYIKLKDINNINFSSQILLLYFLSTKNEESERRMMGHLTLSNVTEESFSECVYYEGSEDISRATLDDVKNLSYSIEDDFIRINPIPDYQFKNRDYVLFSYLFNNITKKTYIDVVPNFRSEDFPYPVNIETELLTTDLTIPLQYYYLLLITPSIIAALILRRIGKKKEFEERVKKFNR